MNLFTKLFTETPEENARRKLPAQQKKAARAMDALIDNIELDLLDSLDEKEIGLKKAFVKGDYDRAKDILIVRSDRIFLQEQLKAAKALKKELFDTEVAEEASK